MVMCDWQPAVRRASITLAKAGDIYWKISENPITSGFSRSASARAARRGSSITARYGLYPEREGNYVKKPMDQCPGAEILEEVLGHLHFDKKEVIMASSICIPCHLPYVNNIWLPRRSGDRPSVVPAGATNLGLIGQYVEVPQDIAFTIEYSTRTAWEAIHTLLKRGPAPPPVYQAQYEPKALLDALMVALGQ